MHTLEDVKRLYQAMHDRLGLGGQPMPKGDGEGRIGFYNADTDCWDWWAWESRKGYVRTGSTAFAT